MRFPEFKEEWETKKLGEIAPLQRGFDLPNQDIIEGGVPIVYSNGISKFHNQSKSQAPGLVTGRSGTIGKFTFIEKGEYWPHNTSLWVTDFCSNHPQFIYYLYQTINIEQFSTGSGVPTLNRNDVHNRTCSIPAVDEQQKISLFLSLIDERISTQNKILEYLESLIENIADQLTDQRLRLNTTFPNWKRITLAELGKTFNGLSGKSKDDFGSGKRYIQYKQIFDSSKIYIENCGLVNISENENQNSVQYGDIFFTISSETPDEIGMSSVLLDDDVKDVYLNSFCFGFRLDSFDKLLPEFARFLFRTEVVRNELKKLAQGSTRYNMSKTELLKLEISLPSIKEQKKISLFLSSLDQKIQTEKAILEQLEIQKKYLLQQMFV